MRPALFRRAMIGSAGVAELTMLAARHCPAASLRAAKQSDEIDAVLEQWEQIVHAGYAMNVARREREMRNSYGAVKWAVVVPWAVQMVVLFVSELVLSGQVEIETLHGECGWS